MRHQNTSSARASQRLIRYGSVLQGDFADAWKRNYDDPEILNIRSELALAQAILETSASEAGDFSDSKTRIAVIAQVEAVTKVMDRASALEIERAAVLTLAQGKTLALGIADDVNRLVADSSLRRSLIEAFGARFAMLLPSTYEEESYRKELEVATATPYYVDAERV